MAVVHQLANRKAFAARLNGLLRQATALAIEIGQVFAEAHKALDHGEWEAMCREDLGLDPSTARRLIIISACPEIVRTAHDLPAGWTTLYELGDAARSVQNCTLSGLE
jgi:hypothetical protein